MRQPALPPQQQRVYEILQEPQSTQQLIEVVKNPLPGAENEIIEIIQPQSGWRYPEIEVIQPMGPRRTIAVSPSHGRNQVESPRGS